MAVCGYRTPDRKRCHRDARRAGNRCTFHGTFGLGEFTGELNKLIDNRDGNWIGFQFPSGFELIDRVIDFPVQANYSTFEDFLMRDVTFEDSLGASHSEYVGNASFINVKISADFSVEGSDFVGKVKFDHCIFDQQANFSGTKFRGDAEIFSQFKGRANFSGADFLSSAKFRGWRKIVASAGEAHAVQLVRVFDDGADFSNVVFRSPAEVIFNLVDMSGAYVLGTDFTGTGFHDVTWYQEFLGRNGIIDEVHMRQTEDKSYMPSVLGRVESAYRNIRKTLENNRDYQTANDFFVGELDIKREGLPFYRKNLLSVYAIYNLTSRYGTSICRSICVLVVLIISHIILNSYIHLEDSNYLNIAYSSGKLTKAADCWEIFEIFLIDALKIMTLQRGTGIVAPNTEKEILDLVFRVLGPLQIAIFAITLRNAVRR